MPKKIYILGYKKLGNWSLAKDTENIKQFVLASGHQVTESMWQADIIFSPWHKLFLSSKVKYLFIFLKKFKKIKFVSFVTHIESSLEQEVLVSKNIVDWWIVANQTEYNNFKSHNLKVDILPFYVDQKVFKKLDKSKEELAKSIGLEYNLIKDKFLIGSFQRDSQGKDLSKAKWQKNPDLLIEVLKRLPLDKILLVLASPRRHYLINACRKNKIPYVFCGDEKHIDDHVDDLAINNIELEKIVALYNLIDLYIVHSRVEGGPKSIVEAVLTETMIVSTKVGMAPDILNRDLLYEAEDLIKITSFIKSLINKEVDASSYLSVNKKRAIEFLDYNKNLDTYKKILNNV